MKPFLFAVLLLGASSPTLAQPEITFPPVRLYRPAAESAENFARLAERAIETAISEQREKFAPAAPALAADPELAEIARGRSQSMADGAPFAHEDAAGNFVAADLVRTRFGPYGAIGENIMEMGSSRAFSPEAFAKVAVEGWMKSPGHRKNILDPDYTQSGIGVAIKNGIAYATQVFFGSTKHARRG